MQLRRYATIAMIVSIAPCGLVAQGRSAADSARHALDRLGYGPTPGKVDSIARTGVMAWVEDQLKPRRVTPGPFGGTTALVTPTPALVALHARQVATALRPRPDSGAATTAPARPGDARALRMVNAELAGITMARAVRAEHQLGEVLADFWMNHFNVLVTKGFARAYFRDHLEHTIREHALGTFRDLLVATARSPAMLFYLDNVQSVAEGASVRPQGRRAIASAGRTRTDSAMGAPDQLRAPRGLNENYARELLELHTLGVDGGYTQADVVDVARILTGWTIARGNGTGGFSFNARLHDRGPKRVLGVPFPAGGGIDEGERLLAMLADHPATMHHVATKLCARFVADAAPDGCIDDAVGAWRRTGGDIRAVVGAIVRSPDFWSPSHTRSKTKTPLEFVASAVRAIGATVDTTPRLAMQVARLGQPLFQHVAPTGYPESEREWVNSGALLARMNFAIALAANRVPGVTVRLDGVIPPVADHAKLVATVDRVILGGMMSGRTRQTIESELRGIADPRDARDLAVGLALGGPEFQRQ